MIEKATLIYDALTILGSQGDVEETISTSFDQMVKTLATLGLSSKLPN
jgi:hypothetical protein